MPWHDALAQLEVAYKTGHLKGVKLWALTAIAIILMLREILLRLERLERELGVYDTWTYLPPKHKH
jgi:hypothetical protein